MDVNTYNRDRQQAQVRLGELTDLAVRYLSVAQLDALAFTMAAYLDGREERALTRLIADQLASDGIRPLELARLH